MTQRSLLSEDGTGRAAKPDAERSPKPLADSSVLRAIARTRVRGKSPLGAFLRLGDWTWTCLPRFATASRPATVFGHLMHALARAGDRRMSFGTFFQRNRPQLQLVCRLADQSARDRVVRMAVLGCSIGADVYSLRWSIASTHPELTVDLRAVDISEKILDVAREGAYSLGAQLVDTPIFERLTQDERIGMFEREGERLKIRPWLKEGIRWRVGDASDPLLVDILGRQDLVIANDFLCHMGPTEAEACLRNIARLVSDGGYLVVSGVDLDVRTKVAIDLGWAPVPDSIEDIHDGDPVLRGGWPWGYWGLEPLDKKRPDWRIRYAAVFQIGARS